MIDNTERVDPQDGHGIPDTSFMGQALMPTDSIFVKKSWYANHAYPANDESVNMRYILLLSKFLSIKELLQLFKVLLACCRLNLKPVDNGPNPESTTSQ
jgi:hypothetical protein